MTGSGDGGPNAGCSVVGVAGAMVGATLDGAGDGLNVEGASIDTEVGLSSGLRPAAGLLFAIG